MSSKYQKRKENQGVAEDRGEDLVTLGKTMRASLDKSLEVGADLVICGLHVIEDPTTWETLMVCFQVMDTIQDLVNKRAKMLSERAQIKQYEN
ncbi:16111_t:CDS:2 [Entrophospora sp. SA101]|nr:16111_t:CDS:2 [Entrophospora sp. SA101]